MLLDQRTAVIYGGAGLVGRAVAHAFARHGATVHLAGRTLAALDEVAADIRAAGGHAETAQLDALDADAVEAHADAVAARAGRPDEAAPGQRFASAFVELYPLPADEVLTGLNRHGSWRIWRSWRSRRCSSTSVLWR